MFDQNLRTMALKNEITAADAKNSSNNNSIRPYFLTFGRKKEKSENKKIGSTVTC